ncbi:MAG: hypothetical protein JNK23_04680 [Opitutaceae bacterium]|nr:hypothetical protein [Opitutaceae bacterium]
MLTPAEIKRQAQRKYPDFVAAHFRGEPYFPHPVRFGVPSPTRPLSELRREVDELWHGSHEFTGHGYRIEFEERRLRLHGDQRLPKRVWFEDASDFLRFVGKAESFRRLQEDAAGAIDAAPMLQPWIEENARELASSLTPGDGRALGLAVDALHHRPLPGCFPREIALPGVSGKFIENNVALLASILRGLGSGAWREADNHHAQLGLRIAPRMLRLMWLNGNGEDFGIPVDRFRPPAEIANVLVVENLRSFLTLPPVPRTLAVYGEGRAAQTLNRLEWLAQVRFFYWGDMDPYGYNMLAALRGDFSGVQSVLMNSDAYESYRHLQSPVSVHGFKTDGGLPSVDPTWHRLAPEEFSAANATLQRVVTIDGVMHAYGIEQEKIPLPEAVAAITRALSAGSTP